MPGRRVRCLLAVALLVASPRVTGAGPNVWTTRGPEGGRIDALAIDPGTPSTVYAGSTGAGVFKSTDGGARWRVANAGLTDTRVRAVGGPLDRGEHRPLYAGTNRDGIFRSTDAGASWSAFSTGLTCGFVRTLAIDPTGTVLHAGTTCGTFDYEIVPRPGA